MYVAVMAFNAKVSDPLIGGTYMTLLNTVSNLGGNWPATVALWLVDPLTVKKCIGVQGHSCASSVAAEVGLVQEKFFYFSIHLDRMTLGFYINCQCFKDFT